MDELVEFLRARLDEREQIARTATPGPWHADGGVHATHPTDEIVDYAGDNAAHIALNDPAYVLADVEAKRRIVDEHYPVDSCDAHDTALRSIACDTLRQLALPFADHESFRGDWQPDA